MVGVAQWLEHQVVDLTVAGSNPVAHPRPMNNPIIKYLAANHFLATIVIIALVWLAIQLNGIIIIIFISYIIMAALSPFSDFLIGKRVPKFLAILIPYAITIAVLVSLIFPLVPFFASQIQLLFGNLPKYAHQVAKIFNLQIDQTSVRNIFESDINALGKNALSFTGQIFSGFFSIFSVLVISFYMMTQKEMLKKQFIGFWDKKYQDTASRTISQVESKIGLWLRGQFVLSLVIGTCVWGGLSILGLPFALPLGLMAGLLEIIPTIGPITASIPAIIVALTISPGLALSVVAFYILLQMLENNLLVPKIMEKAVGLNPIVIIIGVLIGGKFLGVLGSLLTIPFIAMASIIIKSLRPND
jgi:predicted PurR-regulated permease PerM